MALCITEMKIAKSDGTNCKNKNYCHTGKNVIAKK